MADDTNLLIRRLIAGDAEARARLQAVDAGATSPTLLVAAALAGRDGDRLLARAAAAATTTRDRQLVAIAAAHLAGDSERLDALVRDHLADHPDSILAAWIASQHQPDPAGPPTIPPDPPSPRRGKEPTMTLQTTRRLAAATMAAAALLAIAGFTALGSVFEYPQILKSPTAEILDLYRRHQGAVMGWFLVLVVSAALLAPAGVLLGRLAGGRRGRWIAGIGVAAAAVQVVGLSRWVLLVPGISDAATDPARAADAQHRFELVHTWLGMALGETVGYALTATFTVLITRAVTRAVAPRWMAWLGYAAAGLIATGVLIPLGLEAASLTNFAGYVAWCLWLIAMAAFLWRTPRAAGRSAATLTGSNPVGSGG
jgi:hypothetical protein